MTNQTHGHCERNASHDLGELSWTLTGTMPEYWRLSRAAETEVEFLADVPPVPMQVPGSVQKALLDAGVIPDWNEGLNARHCEWVEQRHWIVETTIPARWLQEGRAYTLVCEGLDHAGEVYLDGQQIGTFDNAYCVHEFAFPPDLSPGEHHLEIVFLTPPRWLGQVAWTSRIHDFKPRFNYYWDWTSRLVQLGVWDAIRIEERTHPRLLDVRAETDFDPESQKGSMRVSGSIEGDARAIHLALTDGDRALCSIELPSAAFESGHAFTDLTVEPWWPNGQGTPRLYDLHVRLVGEKVETLDERRVRTGFRRIEWRPCEGAPEGADPWLCVVNGRPVFLQGVNWTPIRPNFADVTTADVEKRLQAYADIGCNILRVWGGAVLERANFYEACDRLGFMVWQEFPMSSSGLENLPPDDPDVIERMAAVASDYLRRRRNHASLILWCGGNELHEMSKTRKEGRGVPVREDYPMIRRLAEVVAREDEGRRFMTTSPLGPQFIRVEATVGQGVHWNVHGPWLVPGDWDEWEAYWERDDALFRAETGAPGASPVELIERYAGDLDLLPIDAGNPLWRRTPFWLMIDPFREAMGRDPDTLAEYVTWSQAHQARALGTAAAACKARFPHMGGIILWMGHDSFPCTANTSILDFDGNPKPAAERLAAVFQS